MRECREACSELSGFLFDFCTDVVLAELMNLVGDVPYFILKWVMHLPRSNICLSGNTRGLVKQVDRDVIELISTSYKFILEKVYLTCLQKIREFKKFQKTYPSFGSLTLFPNYVF